jgi:hypothetical protein
MRWNETFALQPAQRIPCAVVSNSTARRETFAPTGVKEIDAMRRHSLIFSRLRHLVHRGVEMSDFHAAWQLFRPGFRSFPR